MALGRYDEGLKAYDEALRLDPEIAGVWYNRGLVLQGLERTGEAQAAFARAEELQSK